MKKIAIFASGNGSNYQAIVDAVKNGALDASIELLVCDKPNAFVIERAKKESTPIFAFEPKTYETKAAFEKEIVLELQKREIELIVLAGYMRLIGPTLLQAFSKRIINIHPSLLPSFPGKNAIGQALQAGVKVTGVTVHFVDEGMDTGPIIAQESLKVEESDTEQSLAEKVHKIEHRLYPEMIQLLFQKSFLLEKEEASR
ncbi:phosphoribosylglycinamide formyltransferase [Heyndrickxia sporothermodurans]|uniref:Phosphoribosylglycinamide formyltransferase n=1 Tax=Heyndrickxia sporothermodurans TaxID=46224 RepID=A0AB37HLP9_9BACI|nr:phosphoribosylglycinamide formyltransferase [Heyndrickxia sporothermodurans]MBL5766777.1 phosphoribosylglycinamide formyltransferase [Heyndrickxia sporothermodurans]MBL5770405.1 phosphoribosylglycinamide formyltransferase [Heyndrickxia sporothermodurans]MBL5773955.1 phosphoribosylglycinamide formyltransferase [Heyndrickxia sporothermodurans]MBL5777467.1 phosphoribosylglycinamide formyltransferase [Heyndrickxia sporothermodurans]MBL5780978.1 phosphoribosylglycinamide formyltransferase [Heynd